jgi:diaminopimelate decarboxylase
MEKVTAIPNLELELAQELLQVYGSPLYVYNGDILRQTISYITKAISYPHTQFHFASVTNSNIALLKIFKLLKFAVLIFSFSKSSYSYWLICN